MSGLKRLDTGALVKDYEGPDKEIRMAWQMAVSQVAFEDERYIEQPAPPVESEFPEGERVIFVGQHAYGTAAQVVRSGNNTLDVSLAVSKRQMTGTDCSTFPTRDKRIEFLRRLSRRAPRVIITPRQCFVAELVSRPCRSRELPRAFSSNSKMGQRQTSV